MFHVKHRGHAQGASAYRDRPNPIRSRMKSARISCFTWNICLAGRQASVWTDRRSYHPTYRVGPEPTGYPRRLTALYMDP